MADHGTADGENPRRRRPNVLVTGTPGVGKTALASLIAERLGLKHVSVGELIEEHKCYDGRDESLDTNILDEDKLLDALEPIVDEAADEGVGLVMDFHMCEVFPERWFDLVLVLRARTEVLFDRLTARKYSERKRSENMESEIMQVVLEEARESYDPNIVHEVQSDTLQDMENNVDRVGQWMKQWVVDNSSSESRT